MYLQTITTHCNTVAVQSSNRFDDTSQENNSKYTITTANKQVADPGTTNLKF